MKTLTHKTLENIARMTGSAMDISVHKKCCVSAIPMAFSKYHLYVEWHFPKTTWRKLHFTNLTVALPKQKTVEDE